MNNNQLSIRLHGEPVGILEQKSTGKKAFTYDTNAFMAISASMPIRKEPYGEQSCEAYFGGLLPESGTTKQVIGKRFGVSPHNSFALLRAIGYDCAGAISCHAIDDPVVPQRFVPLTGKIITEDELYEHIKELPKKPLFMDVPGLRLSLAGVQDKAAVCLINNQIALPENGCPTTHILKPASPHFDGIAENEYFVMKIAKRIGLSVPDVKLRKIKDITFLLIERYDRHIKNNSIERIHQEDFCQALGVLSSRKYQNDEGPGFKDCFGLLNTTTQPAIDRNQLASVVIFNYLIGNMDAHGKNFSLLHHLTSNIRLAPFYDIVCTRAYQELTSKMAMKIGSKYEVDVVLPRHWKQLSEEISYRYLALANLIKTLGDQIKQFAIQEKNELQAKGINHPIIDKITYFVEGNIDQTLKRFDELKDSV
jgi:serine/threonine-protein kinase HipA